MAKEDEFSYRKLNDGFLILVNESPELMIQFGKCVLAFSSQYGSSNSVSYTVSNLAGEPRVYPKYGDYTVASVFRTYGPWWRQLPSSPRPYLRTPAFFRSEDFVEMSLLTPVVPRKICIYETYNPGSVVRIMAYDASCGTDVDTGYRRWVTLWSGAPERCPPLSRTFSPPLKEVDFVTTLIRLELDHCLEDYYTELDAVLVMGRPDPGAVGGPSGQATMESLQRSLPNSVFALVKGMVSTLRTADRGGATKSEASDKAVTDSSSSSSSRRRRKDLEGTESGYFALLTEELIRLILTYLDLPSICKVAQTCRLLQHHAYDPLLYTEVNLQPYWPMVSGETLRSLQERCGKLQRLSLAWCGGAIHMQPALMVSFFEECGQHLRELNLSCFPITSGSLLVRIFQHCPVLTDVDLSGSEGVEDVDVSELVAVPSFKNVQRLVLYNTNVSQNTVTTMISDLPQLRHLNLGSCIRLHDLTDVAVRLGVHCRQLQTLDLWRAKTLTSTGLIRLASSCPLLQEIDLGWCTVLKSSSGCFQNLAQYCPQLKKIFLTAIRSVNDEDLNAIGDHCKDLQQLDILGTGEVTARGVLRLMESCRGLVFLDVSFCSGVSNECVEQMQTHYPHVDIKKSFQGSDF